MLDNPSRFEGTSWEVCVLDDVQMVEHCTPERLGRLSALDARSLVLLGSVELEKDLPLNVLRLMLKAVKYVHCSP